MDLLVLGGTRFVGRHLVSAAVNRGYKVTTLTRGVSGGAVVEGVEELHADRDGGLEVLGDRTWDAVVDTCGYVPRVVGQSARKLADSVGRYCFISSVSVYDVTDHLDVDEHFLLRSLSDPSTEVVDGDTYGGLKVLCERQVQDCFGERALVLRPGLVVGPYDPTDRFTYWVRRVADGGPLLAPREAEMPVQWIDARDLASFTLDALVHEMSDEVNVIGPPVGMGTLLWACSVAADSELEVTWVDEPWLLERGVEPWTELPMWLPRGSDPTFSHTRALNAGLYCRPARDTVWDTLRWDATRTDRGMAGRLTRAREAELLAAWRSR